MDAIAKDLQVSRSTVSRILRRARQEGVVRITVVEPTQTQRRLAQRVEELFEVSTTVVPVTRGVGEVTRLSRVTATAAELISQVVTNGMAVGCAWGTTLASLVQHLEPQPRHGVSVIQINGGANPQTSGIPYVGQIVAQLAQAFSAETTLFPVPTFFDEASTREAMWRERSIQPLLAQQRAIDLAIFGVGALRGPVSSHVYVGGYLDDDDMRALAEQDVVGDVCTVFLRRDGTWADIDLNARATGLTPAELRRINRRICVAAGIAKTAPVLGALRAGVATDLVIDDALARALVTMVDEN